MKLVIWEGQLTFSVDISHKEMIFEPVNITCSLEPTSTRFIQLTNNYNLIYLHVVMFA